MHTKLSIICISAYIPHSATKINEHYLWLLELVINWYTLLILTGIHDWYCTQKFIKDGIKEHFSPPITFWNHLKTYTHCWLTQNIRFHLYLTWQTSELLGSSLSIVSWSIRALNNLSETTGPSYEASYHWRPSGLHKLVQFVINKTTTLCHTQPK